MRTLRLLVVTLPALLLMSGCFKVTGTFNPEFDPDNIQETGSQFNGTGTFNGEAYDIGIRVTDNGSGAGQVEGDFIFLFLQPQGGGPERVYIGEIGGGNITVHSR